MKTAIKKSLLLVVLLATMVSYGNEISGNTNKGKNVKTSITFKEVKKGSILTIKDINGLVLYSETIKESSKYTRGFDLNSLPDGDYYFELNKDIEIIVVPFMVDATIVTFDKNASSKIFKPAIFAKNKKIYISKRSFEDEVLQIKIFSEKSKMVYSGSIVKEGDVLEKIYDFSTSLRGNYTVVITTNGKTFVEKIKI